VVAGIYLNAQLTNDLVLQTLLSTAYDQWIRFNVYTSLYLNGIAAVTTVGPVQPNGVVCWLNAVLSPLTAANNNTIFGQLSSDPQFSILVSSLVSTGLQNLLDDKTFNPNNQYTLLAPNDAAFTLLTSDQLVALQNNVTYFTLLLQYHLIQHTYFKVGLNAGSFTSLEGDPIDIGNGNNLINQGQLSSATITTYDIATSSGVIHIINNVLIPGSVLNYFSAFEAATGVASLTTGYATTSGSATTGAAASASATGSASSSPTGSATTGSTPGSSTASNTAAPNTPPPSTGPVVSPVFALFLALIVALVLF